MILSGSRGDIWSGRIRNLDPWKELFCFSEKSGKQNKSADPGAMFPHSAISILQMLTTSDGAEAADGRLPLHGGERPRPAGAAAAPA